MTKCLENFVSQTLGLFIKNYAAELRYFKKMSVDNAVANFGVFGSALSFFACFGGYLHFLAGWVAAWLLFAGIFVSAVCTVIIFTRNGWFIHDITETK